jgi:hypothetical protein
VVTSLAAAVEAAVEVEVAEVVVDLVEDAEGAEGAVDAAAAFRLTLNVKPADSACA